MKCLKTHLCVRWDRDVGGEEERMTRRHVCWGLGSTQVDAPVVSIFARSMRLAPKMHESCPSRANLILRNQLRLITSMDSSSTSLTISLTWPAMHRISTYQSGPSNPLRAAQQARNPHIEEVTLTMHGEDGTAIQQSGTRSARLHVHDTSSRPKINIDCTSSVPIA